MKRRFLERCAELDIEVQYERSRRGGHYLMVHAPEGMIFENYGIDCLALWDGEKGNPPDWKYCLEDMERMLPLASEDEDR